MVSSFGSKPLSLRSAAGIFILTFATLGIGSQAIAEVWSAKCRNMEFRFDRTSRKASIQMLAADGSPFEIATGTVGLDNGVALRAIVSQTPVADDDPITEVGLNKSRSIVYLVRHHTGSSEIKDGVFCETPVTVTP